MYLSLEDLWNNVLEVLKSEMTEIGFNTWLKPIKPLTLEETSISLEVEVEFTKGVLESRYLGLIKNSLKHLTGNDFSVTFLLPNQNIEQDDNIDYQNVNKQLSTHSSLNPEYTFSKFVIGSSNRFAHAATVAVAEAPATTYNPLFLYGSSGLGKTHLMHAIGHHILKHNKGIKVMYVQSEKFTNDLINAITTRSLEAFRDKYRTIDVLLIDDIQFIAGKKQTQEEFFHTFNTLYENKKQLIISSDNPPGKIQTLENRLKTRFEQGLIADIEAPDYETRIAILRKKASTENVIVPDNVMEYIANNFVSNVRILQGALTRIIAYASLSNRIIDLELSENVLKDIKNKQDTNDVTIPIIINVVSKYYGITPKEMTSKSRSRDIALPRQIAMYLSRKHTNNSLPKIGRYFGGRDHTTVIHACDKIKNNLKRDKDLIRQIEENERKLSQ